MEITMSQEERDDLHWLKRVRVGSIIKREAAKKMGVTPRRVRMLIKRMKREGDAAVGAMHRRKPASKYQAQQPVVGNGECCKRSRPATCCKLWKVLQLAFQANRYALFCLCN